MKSTACFPESKRYLNTTGLNLKYYKKLMYNYQKKTYAGQALAIIMVVLVVSSIIGFSVFTRSLRDKKSTIQERDSAEAYEVADMILDNMLLTSLKDWENNGLARDTELSNNEISNLFKALNTPLDVTTFSICPLSVNGNNKYTLALKNADENTRIQIQPGQAFTFVSDGTELSPECSITVKFWSPQSNSGFMINKIYRDAISSGNIKDYDYSDADAYCFGPITNCGSFSKVPDLVPYNTSEPLTILMSSNPPIDRVQIIAINDIVTFSYNVNPSCGEKFRSVVLRSSATCNGVYRAKEVIIPEAKSNYSIFNYVLFNGVGSLSPS
ncbi:MAG: hypothetical protein ACOX0R_02100 [Candidatus Dojkabacteria bacterium]|jgi:type II secretory pathway pseudopilin PulG